MTRRTLGILGGMGPEATVDLYRQILGLTPARKDQDHFPVLSYSNPVSRIEPPRFSRERRIRCPCSSNRRGAFACASVDWALGKRP
jgi:hypothetical protein